MKKLILAFVILGTISITSCKRNWTCQCIDQNETVTNNPINGGSLYHAKKTCKDMNFNQTIGGVHTSEDCSLYTLEK